MASRARQEARELVLAPRRQVCGRVHLRLCVMARTGVRTKWCIHRSPRCQLYICRESPLRMTRRRLCPSRPPGPGVVYWRYLCLRKRNRQRRLGNCRRNERQRGLKDYIVNALAARTQWSMDYQRHECLPYLRQENPDLGLPSQVRRSHTSCSGTLSSAQAVKEHRDAGYFHS